jgi:hypothetical protein
MNLKKKGCPLKSRPDGMIFDASVFVHLSSKMLNVVCKRLFSIYQG